MIIAKDVFENMINSPIRTLRGRVEIFEGSTLALVCSCHDRLIDFKIERVGEKNKFFGYGICQKLTTNLLDKERALNITTKNHLEVEFGVGSDYLYPCPNFYVDDVKRDETTNNLTITAYDALYKAAEHKVEELELPIFYTIRDFAGTCAALLGIPMKDTSLEEFNRMYSEGANLEGTETIREALNAVAEATQTIYFINKDWELEFKRLDVAGEPVALIDKTKYFSLDSKENVTLSTIAHVTELGDNISASKGDGATQYIRNNPFWELREDITTIVDNALAVTAGLTLNQFTCEWRGNYLLEIGDKIAFTTKDDNTVISYLLDDKISFNGSLSGSTSWSYEADGSEVNSNPTSLGEVVKQTYARVDKANKKIEMIASEVATNSQAISSLEIATDGITASVTSVETNLGELQTQTNNEIQEISKKVEATMSAEDVRLEIQSGLANGTEKVVTKTGFKFDEEGLTVEKSDSEMSTQITEDGMTVSKSGEEMLTANHEGVQAKNLHAVTYLIIGNNSRLEDYNGRTGCFWIGG